MSTALTISVDFKLSPDLVLCLILHSLFLLFNVEVIDLKTNWPFRSFSEVRQVKMVVFSFLGEGRRKYFQCVYRCVKEGGVFAAIVNGNLDREIDLDQVEIKVVERIVCRVFSSHA